MGFSFLDIFVGEGWWSVSFLSFMVDGEEGEEREGSFIGIGWSKLGGWRFDAFWADFFM
jgi:hypothetical protein